jgi:hypothetical protein
MVEHGMEASVAVAEDAIVSRLRENAASFFLVEKPCRHLDFSQPPAQPVALEYQVAILTRAALLV